MSKDEENTQLLDEEIAALVKEDSKEEEDTKTKSKEIKEEAEEETFWE